MEERVIRVLLVEDSGEDAQAILATLACGGFSVVSRRVESAAQLRDALRSGDWDLALSGFDLPGFGAIETLDILKTLQAQVPLIVVAGAIGEESAAAAIKAGAIDLVTKQGLHRLIPAVERSARGRQSPVRYEAALAALNESEARFRAIAANLPGVVFQSLLHDDGSADLVYVSEGSPQVLGVAADILMSHPEMLLDMILPEDRESFVAMRIRAATRLAPRNWEGRIRVNGQEIKWVNLRASARRLPSGSVISDGIISNITESKLAQQAFERQQHQLRQLASHIERVKEEERSHVAREIHDDLGSILTAAKIDLAWIRSRLDAGQTALAEKTGAMETLLDSAIEATGRISRNLRPPVLDYGVAAAIEWQVREFRRRMDVACDFACPREDIALDREYSTALFRIFQEALTNIAKHAGASRVEISLQEDGGDVVLTVTDDGRGIDGQDMHKNGSYGIRGMRERAGFLGGTIEVCRAPGAGTQVRVRLPAKRPPLVAES